LIPATGGEPKRLAEGASPGWTKHPTRLYYHSRGDNAVYYIDVGDTNTEPVRVAHCAELYPQVSPDERYLAYATAGELTVIDLSSGERIVKWVIPSPEQYCVVRWSPDGREISLSALGRFHYCSGLWIFDIEQETGRHLLDAEAVCCNWTQDRSRVALDVFFPTSEIWATQVDPNIPTWQSLGPLQSRGQYLRSHWQEYVASYTRLDAISAQRALNNLREVGINQYECGEYEDALWTLQHVTEAWSTQGFTPDVKTHGYRVMALQKLGHTAEPAKALQELSKMYLEEDDITDTLIFEILRDISSGTALPGSIWYSIKQGELASAAQVLQKVADHAAIDDVQLNEVIKMTRMALTRALYRRGKTAQYRDEAFGQAVRDFELAIHTDPNFVPAMRALAWLHATCVRTQHRNGLKAIAEANRACELTDWQDYHCLSILAAACAETGQFSQAVKWQERALNRLPQDAESPSGDELKARLRLYQKGIHHHGERVKALVAWWRMDEINGSRMRDSSGNEHHGDLLDEARWSPSPGRFGGALELSGESSGVKIPHESAFDFAEALTVAAWVKPTGTPKPWQGIIAKGVWPGTWALTTDSTGHRVSFSVAVREATITSHARVTTGQWHHVCATYDGTYLRLYVDGVADTVDSVLEEGGIRLGDAPLCIGSPPNRPEQGWTGLVDDVRIYSKALSHIEVKALHEGL
ncbi:MAG: hypothetical protein HQ515_18790, partial [Phycisphaeraceae bacterium]|nr:hypothetical protein [Phycisphaeraceae bacterium]